MKKLYDINLELRMNDQDQNNISNNRIHSVCLKYFWKLR